MKQTISDIIDQELGSADAGGQINRIAEDADGCRSWRNYHLIGDVIRGDVKTTGPCLIDRVEAALAEEPTVLAPAPQSTTESVTGAATTSTGSRGETLKAAGLFSLAASIALVAVLTQVPATDDLQQGPTVAATATPATAVGEGVAGANPNRNTEDIAAEFGQMLVEHGEFTTATGLNGLLAYAKVVSNQPIGE